MIRADLHTHIYPFERKAPHIIAEDIFRKGVDVIALLRKISVHKIKYNPSFLRELSRQFQKKNMVLLDGFEIETREGHIIGIFCNETPKPNKEVGEVADFIKERGGIVIVPHPYMNSGFTRYQRLENAAYSLHDRLNLLDFDYLESFNLSAELLRILTFGKPYFTKLPEPTLTTTDAHFFQLIGMAYTIIDCENDVESIYRALKKKKILTGQTQNLVRSLLLFALYYPSYRNDLKKLISKTPYKRMESIKKSFIRNKPLPSLTPLEEEEVRIWVHNLRSKGHYEKEINFHRHTRI